MPEDDARREIDLVLKEAMRRGVAAEPEPGPWTLHTIRATLPDGGGAQSIGIALQSAHQLQPQGHALVVEPHRQADSRVPRHIE